MVPTGDPEDEWYRLQVILKKPVFLTNHGECWHASAHCAQEATLNQIHMKRPCKKCYYGYEEVTRPPEPDASAMASTGVSLTPSN